MSTDLEERPAEAPEPAPPARRRRSSYLRDRILLPLVIVVIAALVIVVVILNLSRVFLANAGSGAVILCASVAGVGFILAAWATSQGRVPVSQTLGLIAVIGFLLVLAGWGFLDNSESHGGEEGPVAASEIQVTGFNFGFDPIVGQAQTNEEAPGLRVDYRSRQGSHTFVVEGFEDEFELAADTSSGETGVIVLAPGEYVFYCSIAGHRQNGMESTLTVLAAPPGTVLEEGGEGGPGPEGGEPAEGGEGGGEPAEGGPGGGGAPGADADSGEGGSAGEGGSTEG